VRNNDSGERGRGKRKEIWIAQVVNGKGKTHHDMDGEPEDKEI